VALVLHSTFAAMRIALVILFLVLQFIGVAGKVEKAFEALHIYNYFEAKRLFEKIVKKDSVAGPYGLSIIYTRKDNPFHNRDSAYKFVLMADKHFEKLDEKSKAKLFAHGIDQEEIASQMQLVSILFFEKAQDSMTTKGWNDFLTQNPWSRKRSQAILIRDSLAFCDANRDSTWKSFSYFIETYPSAKKIPEAQKRYNRLFYLDKTQPGNVSSFQQFVKLYPNNPHVSEAHSEVYRLLTANGTSSAYHSFIHKNPNNPHVIEAWKKLYHLHVKRNTSQEIDQFINQFPDYPNKAELLENFDLAKALFLPFKQGPKWGFIDTTGKVRIEANYDWVESFNEGSALVGKGDYSGYINKRGETIIPFDYDDGGDFNEGYAWVEKDGKYGMLNHQGARSLDIKYNDVGSFSNGIVYLQKGDKYAFADNRFFLITPFKFNRVSPFKNGYAIVETDSGTGVVDSTGNYLFQCVFTSIRFEDSASLWVVKNDTAWALFNLNADTISPFVYSELNHFSENRIMARSGNKFGYLNYQGDTLIELDMDFNNTTKSFGYFKNGVAKTEHNAKVGLIDSLGQKVYPRIFKDVGEYGELTAVKKNELWGFANQAVKLKVKYQYEHVTPFKNGRATVSKEGKTGVINVDNEFVIPLKYDQIKYYNDTLLQVTNVGFTGLIDLNDNVVLPIKYSGIYSVTKEIVRIELGDNMAYLNLTNKRVIFATQGFIIP
jgi:TolA-binding protein